MSEWQPIATAPKVYNWQLRQMRAVGTWKHRNLGWLWGQLEWHTDNDKHHDGGYFLAANGEPTHWMTLPAAPDAGEQA